ncbi:MAG: hypothetical protein SPL30_06855, partial [Succinivibrio sp.]|nr:hypothetical protein [Succinivibrio sp.]
ARLQNPLQGSDPGSAEDHLRLPVDVTEFNCLDHYDSTTEPTENRMVLNLLKLGTDINQISTAAGWSVDQTLAFARKHNLPVKQ